MIQKETKLPLKPQEWVSHWQCAVGTAFLRLPGFLPLWARGPVTKQHEILTVVEPGEVGKSLIAYIITLMPSRNQFQIISEKVVYKGNLLSLVENLKE